MGAPEVDNGGKTRPSTSPISLRLFGESGYGALWRSFWHPLTARERIEVDHVGHLFPEAAVIWTVEL